LKSHSIMYIANVQQMNKLYLSTCHVLIFRSFKKLLYLLLCEQIPILILKISVNIS